MDDQEVAGGERRPIGSTIDALGVSITQAPGELIQHAIVIVSVIDSDGQEWLRTGWSGGLGWVMRNGMLHSVRLIDDAKVTE